MGVPQHLAAMGDWKHGLFDCFSSINLTCLYSVYCAPCALHDMAEEYEPGSGMLRAQAREKNQIEGSIPGDCCTSCCCTACAMIQLHRQIDPKTNLLGLKD